jgi:transcriptional regulator GlxA family with amidase domain
MREDSMFLVDRILGRAIRAETARFVLADTAAGEGRYFTGFAPPQMHGDRAVLKAQEWVHMRDGSVGVKTELVVKSW